MAPVPPEQVKSLYPAQLAAYNLVIAGKSVMITGAGGTGKSKLLHAIREALDPKVTFFTSTTGLSATYIGASTLHSFAGAGLAQEDLPDLLRKVRKNTEAKTRWSECKTLVIDEVSMLQATFFDKLEFLARKIRDNEAPFGGIQLVLTGDFLQLRPVPGRDKDGNKVEAQLAFRAQSWDACVPNVVVLDKGMRQSDPEFKAVLNKVRLGVVDKAVRDFFAPCINRVLQANNGVEPTDLYAVKRLAADENTQRLGLLPGDLYEYNAIDKGERYYVNEMQKNSQAPEKLELKVGAQVMLLTNMDTAAGLVNGSRGVVVAFSRKIVPMGRTTSTTAEIKEDDDKAREDGDDDEKQETGTTRRWKRVRSDLQFPVVQFLNGYRFSVTPFTTRVEVRGTMVASREQLPLMLAFSLTMHKIQGTQLDFVKLHLQEIFEDGQAYVALSRATNRDGLAIVGDIPWWKVRANEDALMYYRSLESYTEGRVAHPPFLNESLLASPTTLSGVFDEQEDEQKQQQPKPVRTGVFSNGGSRILAQTPRLSSSPFMGKRVRCSAHDLPVFRVPTSKRKKLGTSLLEQWTCSVDVVEGCNPTGCLFIVDSAIHTLQYS